MIGKVIDVRQTHFVEGRGLLEKLARGREKL